MSEVVGHTEIVAMIREYAKVNWAEVSASIVGGPILRGNLGLDAEVVSEEMQLHATIHSAKFHAAKDILLLIGEDVSDL